VASGVVRSVVPDAVRDRPPNLATRRSTAKGDIDRGGDLLPRQQIAPTIDSMRHLTFPEGVAKQKGSRAPRLPFKLTF